MKYNDHYLAAGDLLLASLGIETIENLSLGLGLLFSPSSVENQFVSKC